MALVELIMPKMGESITEATVLSWLKKPGDKIELEEAVLEVATDKVDTEIPSTHAGILKEILVQKGEIVQVGSPIAILTVEAEASGENNTDDVPSTSREATTEAHTRPPASKEYAVSHTNGKQSCPRFQVQLQVFFPARQEHCEGRKHQRGGIRNY